MLRRIVSISFNVGILLHSVAVDGYLCGILRKLDAVKLSAKRFVKPGHFGRLPIVVHLSPPGKSIHAGYEPGREAMRKRLRCVA